MFQGLRPAGKLKGSVKLLQRARQHEINGIAGQSVPGNCETRYPFALENFETHADDARQDNVGCYSTGDGQRQHSRQPAIRKSKDKSDQPDGKDAQP